MAMVEANAWTFGPNATALRILSLTLREKLDPEVFWRPLIQGCPRMSPLGYWIETHLRGGLGLEAIAGDFLRRESVVVGQIDRRLRDCQNVLIAGHDRELEQLWQIDAGQREYRYLLLDGLLGSPSPGEGLDILQNTARIGAPFSFRELESALDWADALVLSGFVLHRQNLLGPSQLRPLLLSSRDQVDPVLLVTTNERRLTLGLGAPSTYRDDFRPYLWQESISHLISEWHERQTGTRWGWLPMPPDVLSDQFQETLEEGRP